MTYERSRAIEKRLVDLVGVIRGGRHSARSLADVLAISQPTGARCLAALRDRGYVIRSVRDACGWSYEIVSEPEFASQESGAVS